MTDIDVVYGDGPLLLPKATETGTCGAREREQQADHDLCMHCYSPVRFREVRNSGGETEGHVGSALGSYLEIRTVITSIPIG
jgi:hypothetical protein